MRILVCLASGFAVLPLALAAYKDGPVPGRTGGFGGPTCHACHLDNAVNAPGGQLTLLGIPERYTPGATYQITVQLTRPEVERAGFEIAARFAAGELAGRQAGVWRPTDNRAEIHTAETTAVQFVQHTSTGTGTRMAGHFAWTLSWAAPESSTPVQFNVAANATNDDSSPLGDYVYTSEMIAIPTSAPRLRSFFSSSTWSAGGVN